MRFRSLSQHQAHGSTTNGSVTNSVRAPGAVLAGTRLLLVAEGAKDGVILVAGDVEVMKALPA